MAAVPPRDSRDGPLDPITLRMVKPIPESVKKFVRDYDISKMAKMLSAPDHRSLSFKETMESINKNLDLFKKPHACRAPLDFVDFDDDDDDEEEDEDDDDEEEMICDEEKPNSGVELQVPNEGERKCKKPRLSESFECQGLGEEIEAEETSNSH